ncbi:MAG TPA: Gldg family protein [Planctomycetota bacterium]|nr:Gldg family protein [Planctomycetota bacterium]
MNRSMLVFMKFVQFIALGVIVLCLFSLFQRAHVQVDATEEKLVQLSPETVAIIDSLNPEKHVTIRAFFSREVTKELVETKGNLLTFLHEIEVISNGKVDVQVNYIEPDTDAAFKAEDVYGIKAREVTSFEGGGPRRMKVYMALVFSAGLKESTIDFFEQGMSEELELVRNIKVVNGDKLKRIGVLYTDAHLMGDFDFNSFRQIPGWQFVAELQKQYEVVGISSEDLRKYYYDNGSEVKPDEKFDVLIAPMPSTLTERELYYLHQYIYSGAPVLILDDPWPTGQTMWQLAPKRPKVKRSYPGQPPEMGAPPKKGNIEKLFDCMGVNWKSGEVVWAEYDPHPALGIEEKHVMWLGASVPEGNRTDGQIQTTNCFAKDNDITSNLQEIVMLFGGGLEKTAVPPADIKFEPLLISPLPCGRHTVEEMFPDVFSGSGRQTEPPHLSYPSDLHDPITLAAAIKGHMRNAYPEGAPKDTGDSGGGNSTDDTKYSDPKKQPATTKDGYSEKTINVIFLPDIDLVSDQFFQIRNQRPEIGGVTLDFDNTRFVLNCVDSLAGDTTFLKLRNRRPLHRPMEMLDSIRQKNETELMKFAKSKDDEAKAAVDSANDRVKKMREEIDKRTDLDVHAKEVLYETVIKTEEDRIQVLIKDKQREADHEKAARTRAINAEIEWIKIWYTVFPIAIPLTVVLLIGLGVFVYRLVTERTEVPSARKRA